ncbi:LPS-assembly protein LptD [Endozoicomonas sp. 4G]|uniref:LPS-assembly protein LptD n=1 Tax=Endozoicomonas sp. 4G TaxID=2872754 RepID=UPI002078D18B|nr:LPS-assembly protein LptD [Endozoicomonas sp. 4G]
MEKHPLPFKPRTLPLAIAAVLLASQPATRVYAESSLSPDDQWSCKANPDGSGWQCSVEPVKPTVMKRASRPAAQVVTEPTGDKSNRQTPTVATSNSRANLRTTLDWVPKSQLSRKEQKALDQTTPWCTGDYSEPPRPGKHFKGDPDSAPIIAESDESSYDQDETATLTGNVSIRQGNRQIQSDIARVNRATHYAEFEGNVVFREPGTLLVGDYGDMLLDTGRATFENASYALHGAHARGSSKEIIRNEDSSLVLEDASYTTCRPGDESWLLTGKNVTLDHNTGYGTARDAVIRVEGLPIFYAPYLYFPIDSRRQSGFLYPSIAVDGESGMDLTLPYYWNIAPNYDATITPRIITKRGLLLENQFRYMNKSGEGEAGIAGLIGKDKLEKENPYYDQERWLANVRYQQRFSERWTAELDYADASDKNYIEDFGTSLNLSSTGPLNQKVGTQYLGGNTYNNWTFSLNAHQFKNMNQTADDPYNKLPQLVFSGNWQAGETLKVSYLADYTQFSRADDWRFVREVEHPDFDDPDIRQSVYDEGYGVKKAEGGRAYAQAGASYPMQTIWGFLTPEVKVRSVNYNLSNLVASEVVNDLQGAYGESVIGPDDFTKSPSTTAGSFSLDSGLYFERFTNLFGTDFTHTLEPRAKYLYVPYVENQEYNPTFDTAAMGFTYSSLWLDNRFSGYDRIGDANQLSLGVTTRLIEDDGFERMRFGIGQIVHFRDREVYIATNLGFEKVPIRDIEENHAAMDDRLRSELTDPTSPLASEFIYNFNRAMSVRQDFSWNTNENRLDNYGLYYRWKPEQRKTLNLGFRFRDQVDRYVQDEDGHNVLIDPTDPGKGFQTHGNNLKQTDLSFAWPIPMTTNWVGLGRWQYDLTNERNLESLAGVEYNSCCYQVRFFWRSWIETDDNIDHPDPKSGIFFQFILRGLGNITGSSGTEYLQAIQGYEIHEK